MRAYRVPLALLCLSSWSPLAAATTPRLVSPTNGAVLRDSAVAVEVALDGLPVSAVRLDLNGVDVTPRLRPSSGVHRALFAGVPGQMALLRRGSNRLVLHARGATAAVRFRWHPRVERVRVIVVGNRIDFDAYTSAATWQAEIDRIFETLVRPHVPRRRPTIVLLTEEFGLPTTLLGSRGAVARAMRDVDLGTAAALLNAAYEPQMQFYLDRFALPGLGRAFFLAVSDTLWRTFVPPLAAKAAELGVYLVACTNVAPVHRSTDPGAVAFFGDVDDPTRSDVFLPDGIDVYNTAFLWDPTGALLGTTRKVFITEGERDFLSLSSGVLDDVGVFDTAAGRIGIAISLDAFTAAYVNRLADLGATLVLQPDAYPTLWASPPQVAWPPDLWEGSVLGMLGSDNITYNATSMITGNFFPGILGADGLPTGVVFDGQSSVTRKASRPPHRGFIGGAEFKFPGEFVALAPWAFPDPAALRPPADLGVLRARCNSPEVAGSSPRRLAMPERRRILYDCAKTLLPGGRNAGRYRESVITADLRIPVGRVYGCTDTACGAAGR